MLTTLAVMKELEAIFLRNFLDTQYMNDCIIFEVSVKNKKGYFSLFRSSSKSHVDFEDFLFKLPQIYHGWFEGKQYGGKNDHSAVEGL